MKKKIIAIVLVLTLSINFIGEVKVKANPAIPIVGGVALLGFLLTATSLGLDFNAVEEANKLMQDFESKNNSSGSPNLPPNFTKTGLILALAGLAKKGDDVFAEKYREYRDNLVDYLKGFLTGELEAGENEINLGNYIYVPSSGKIYESGYYYIDAGKRGTKNYYLPFKLDIQGKNATITFIDDYSLTTPMYYQNHSYNFKFEYLYIESYYQTISNPSRFITTFKFVTDGAYEEGGYLFNDMVKNYSYYSYVDDQLALDRLVTDTSELSNETLNFNIDPESPLLDETKPDLPNKPNITGLKNVTPVVNNNGTTSYVYNGTSDELVQELINTISLDRLVNPNDYTMTENENGQITVTPPDPNINPFEQTDSSNEVGLLQQIINWLKRLWELPTSIIQNLFTVPEDLTLDTSKIRLNQFQLKFPFSIPWDLYKSIEVFAVGMSEPALEIDLDTEFFQVYHKIDLNKIALPLAFFRYCIVIFFIMFLINKTRDLIKW